MEDLLIIELPSDHDRKEDEKEEDRFHTPTSVSSSEPEIEYLSSHQAFTLPAASYPTPSDAHVLSPLLSTAYIELQPAHHPSQWSCTEPVGDPYGEDFNQMLREFLGSQELPVSDRDKLNLQHDPFDLGDSVGRLPDVFVNLPASSSSSSTLDPHSLLPSPLFPEAGSTAVSQVPFSFHLD